MAVDADFTFTDYPVNTAPRDVPQVLVHEVVEALSGVFKYRSPAPGSLGMAYVGILWLPFQDYTTSNHIAQWTEKVVIQN